MRATALAVFISLFLGLALAQGIGANYEVVANKDGTALVLATFTGDGTLEIPLPGDVSAPYVKGALYLKSADSIVLSLTADSMAVVSYSTDMLVQKNGDARALGFELPENVTNTYVSISLPKEASVSGTVPQDGIIMSEGDSVLIAWAYDSPLRRVSVSYEFPKQGNGGEGDGEEPAPQDFMTPLLLAAGGFLLVLLLSLAAVYISRRRKGRQLCITEGMRSVLKALNENDVRILEELCNSGGEMRRSELERRTGIAKSSLALSLDRLEKKGILSVGKETTTHKVSLTEWFRSL